MKNRPENLKEIENPNKYYTVKKSLILKKADSRKMKQPLNYQLFDSSNENVYFLQ